MSAKRGRRNARGSWSETINERGIKVRLYMRGTTIWIELRKRDRNGRPKYTETAKGRVYQTVRKSLGHGDRELAREQARAAAVAQARLLITGVPDQLTLGQLFDWYRVEMHSKLNKKNQPISESWKQAARMRMDLFEQAWGRETLVSSVDQIRVNQYVALRRSCKLTPLPGSRKGRGTRSTPAEVRAGTLDGDFRWLRSVFNYATSSRRSDGSLMLDRNPLRGLSWPREQNPMRPVASAERYTKTQEHTDAVDPQGRLRCILALARYTGRRESAILHLLASDLLLNPARIRAALLAAGRSESDADHMVHGAILWRAAHDKQGVLHVAPLSLAARAEIDLYLQRSPRVGEVPLFPGNKDPDQPLNSNVASTWLLRAERLAELPKLRGGTWHPYRRAWATDRKHLPDIDVAAAGGWKDTRALKISYQQADAAMMARVVEAGS